MAYIKLVELRGRQQRREGVVSERKQTVQGAKAWRAAEGFATHPGVPNYSFSLARGSHNHHAPKTAFISLNFCTGPLKDRYFCSLAHNSQQLWKYRKERSQMGLASLLICIFVFCFGFVWRRCVDDALYGKSSNGFVYSLQFGVLK